MVFIDAHCHLDFFKDSEIEKIIDNAKKSGVKIHLICLKNF